MATRLKVLTLNCWGVFTPIACKDRHERISAIGQAISKEDYDVVLLQEIWSHLDYCKLQAQIGTVMREEHFFHSGMIGSGVCIFSRHPIIETHWHPFLLNGYFHKIYHGDWFGGKGVGLAKILFNGYKLNIYSTHLHAQYEPGNDEYIAHRVSQAHQVAQFIRLTSSCCDAVLLGGDLNLTPEDLGYKLITANAALQDAWLTQEASVEGENGCTCDRPDNIYHCAKTLTYAPNGLRLDYLLYRTNQGTLMTCTKCYLCMGKVAGEAFPYSDHEGVAAVFTLSRADTAGGSKRDSGKVERYYTEALPVMDAGNRKVRTDQVRYAVLLVLCIALLLVSEPDMSLPWIFSVFTSLLRVVMVIVAAYCFWMGVVMCNWELNGILATRKDINNLLRSNPQ